MYTSTDGCIIHLMPGKVPHGKVDGSLNGYYFPIKVDGSQMITLSNYTIYAIQCHAHYLQRA